ncbi:MAG: hypothetical protein ABR928_04605 [Terracidiphilus sp.]
MKLPLRSLAVFTSGIVCFGSLFSVAATRAGISGPGVSGGSYPADVPAGASAEPQNSAVIPGPLRSFLRMAGISQQVSSDDVLPMLARNLTLWGREGNKETEFLVLLTRYVEFARSVRSLTGPDGAVHVANCDEASKLVPVLGYRFEHSCGQRNAFLVTANAERAFLTVDSGFPLARLEESLAKHTPFSFEYPVTQVPALLTQKEWIEVSPWGKNVSADLLDVLLHDAQIDRLYAALGHCDPETRNALATSPGLGKLLPIAAVLDFYGSRLSIRSGQVVVPGGANHEWQELVGASPSAPGEFVANLLEKDRGWLAAYFDAVARVDQQQESYLTHGDRLKRLYAAYRSSASSVSAADGVFSRNSNLLLLFTRLEWDAQGQPRVPGDLTEWSQILSKDSGLTGHHEWAKRMHGVDSPDHLLEDLVAFSNEETDVGPVQLYLMLSAINANRAPAPGISEETARLLADHCARYSSWYPIFVEFPQLDDMSIKQFINIADVIDKLPNQNFRSNALGAIQADIGMWTILARQGQIPKAKLEESWQSALQPFATIGSAQQLFDAARGSLNAAIVAAGGQANSTQDEIVDLLAGPAQTTPDGQRVHQELARRIKSVLDDQRLVSLDTLYGLYDGLNTMAHGGAAAGNMQELAGSLREFELPRPIFSNGERASWSPVIYSSRHAELQVRTDLKTVIGGPGTTAQLESARGKLTPFLRDTLVGLNYAYYEPPGAQVLHNNPLFVRSHDFSTFSVLGVQRIWGAPELVGIGVTAGGGAYLMGSLADLPYALAQVEEDFIAPANVQALIWRETAPQLLASGVVPRWWGVNHDEMHAAALYQHAGEELLRAAGTNAKLREELAGIFAEYMPSGRLARIESALSQPEAGGTEAWAREIAPSDCFYLAAGYRKHFSSEAANWGTSLKELDELSRKDPQAVDPQRISLDFGVPHLEMEQSDAPTLVETGIFPVSGGYTNRLFGESWESSNLYWARVADDMGYSPVMLNLLVPELTRQMVTRIFATNVDDWPAILRAMKQTGDAFQQGKIAVASVGAVSGQ